MKRIMEKGLAVVFAVLLCTAGCAKAEDPVYFASDFSLQDVNQEVFTLSAFRDKQPVLLFFWTTWCPFCQQELQVLKDMYGELSEEGIEVASINVGEAPAKVSSAVTNLRLPFRVLMDQDTAVTSAYRIVGVPTFVLVNQQGEIVFQDNHFPQDYQELLSKKQASS